eukprot:TRINITY_DN9215_c0_g1_i2.p1 TRINITY_DN9215_c0_g1~~TRINITY_DN9215_c0_g1_i2.p1  ORF type:complete len:457 (-),score=129.99 TRINITY_DN9215_c0_g1_i2:123-1493(-)
MGYAGAVDPVVTSVYVCNLPPGTDEMLLANHFGTIGVLKKDKRTGRPKIWIYKDKVTNEPKGDAMITYEDPHAASAAVDWFNNTEFHGNTISVYIAESKNKESTEQVIKSNSVPMATAGDNQGLLGDDISDDWNGGGRGKGRGETGGKAWQQEGDWLCPNPSCSNVNFAFRGVCNRCGTARPAGSAGSGGASGGRGRGRGNIDSGRGRGVGGPPGLFGPNDWPCPMCGNINWAKRTKCNVCNTNKPGHSEGGVRGGRAGGYKELDEEEIEETRRRRREVEEDDGEMYDEFGNLKKKFRAKHQRNEGSQTVPGLGKAGWDEEALEVVDRDGKDKSRDRGRDRDHGRDRSRDRDSDRTKDRDREGRHRNSGDDKRDYDRYDHERGRSADRDYHIRRDRDRSRDRERDRDREKGRGKDRDRHRDKSRDYDRPKERESGYDYYDDRHYGRERERKSDRSY